MLEKLKNETHIPNGFGDAGFLGFSFGCIAVLCSTPVAGSTEGEQRADKTNKDVDSETGRFRSVGYRVDR